MRCWTTTLLLAPVLAMTAYGGDAKEDAAATRLLKDARAARVTWQKFPGFTANLIVNQNGQTTRGAVSIDATGKIDLKDMKAGSLKTWVRRQLSSIVLHRKSNASERDTPCAFADKIAYHPLGRKINVLNDELHSSYRIRDRQIIEVNRTMKGGVNFTITVLKNYETPNKQFLPASYVVNTWTKGKLISSTAHYNTWKKIGQYYLPKSVMIVTATGTPVFSTSDVAQRNEQQAAASTLDARTIEFSNLRLLKRTD